MGQLSIISNERQANEAGTLLSELDQALSSEQVFASLVKGLPGEVIEGVRRSLATERWNVAERLRAYKEARDGDLVRLKRLAGSDLGAQLIVARIAKGLSQKDLARKLGLQEQAVQRYEAERYRTISLANYQKFAAVLGVGFIVADSDVGKNDWGLPFEVDHSAASKVLKHARSRGWLKSDESSEEKGLETLKRAIGDHVVRHGTPSLLRTGLNIVDHSQDLSLLAWKAHVTRRAERVIRDVKPKFRLTEISWLIDLVRLSRSEECLAKIPEVLLDKGIVVIFEPQVPGMKVDGAAFVVDEVPVIGMTLLRDALDNFWFTLVHELAHVFLHYRMGLQSGFFDDLECAEVDEIEDEANQFASNLLIPEEFWVRSPARIAKSPEPIENFAQQLCIHPAIVFGRIRKERANYAIFSDRIGSGLVRKRLMSGIHTR